MPAPIVLANLEPKTKMGNESPKIATRFDLRDGSRGDSGGDVTPDPDPVVPTDAPVITSVAVIGDTLTIQGSNFGSKSRPAPAFVDYGHKAYEVGALNTTHGDNLVDGSPLRGGNESHQLYAGGQTGAAAVTYRTQGPKRHSAQVASYQMGPAKNSFFGEPKSFTWSGPNNRPYRPRYYQANWFYFPDNPGCMWLVRIPQAEITAGNPVQGERVNINGITAKFGGYDPTQEWANIHFDGSFLPPNNLQLSGQTLTFETSGMTFVWPTSKGVAPYNYEAPGFKYARIWPTPDRDTPPEGRVIASLSSNDWYLSGGALINKSPTNSVKSDLAGGKWHLSEFLIDLTGGWAEHRFDGVLRGTRETFNPTSAFETSFTMNLWGTNGRAGGMFNQQSVESSYCDDSLHRVVVSTAANKANLRIDNTYHFELQRPSAWNDGAITAAFVPGALPSGQTLYVYVFNDANECNENGYNIGVQV